MKQKVNPKGYFKKVPNHEPSLKVNKLQAEAGGFKNLSGSLMAEICEKSAPKMMNVMGKNEMDMMAMPDKTMQPARGKMKKG